MKKEDYVAIANKKFKGNARQLLINQIDEFYNICQNTIRNPKYECGDEVLLKKGTFIHGFGNDLNDFDKYSKDGVISKDFEEKSKERHKVNYCLSVWNIQKNILLKDYVRLYSGMTIEYGDKYKVVPYGEIENYLQNIKKEKWFDWQAKSTMEISYLPSLAKDDRQIAFIFNTKGKQVKQIIKNDLNNDEIPLNTVLPYFKFLNKERETIFKNNRHYRDGERIGYVVFGLPSNMIEGVLIGRQYEKNSKILKHIKEKLPNCYICNLDGKVIVS